MVQSHFIVKPNLVLRLDWGFDKKLIYQKIIKWVKNLSPDYFFVILGQQVGILLQAGRCCKQFGVAGSKQVPRHC